MADARVGRMNVPGSAFFLLFALSSFGAGLFLATAHPLVPFFAVLGFLGVFFVGYWRPWLGLALVPAFLPVLNFSPWTGWLIVDEFDLLVLAVVAGGYLRLYRDGFRLANKRVLFVFLGIVLLLLSRGASDLDVEVMSGFSGYTTPLNTFRVGKSLLWVVLMIPLVAHVNRIRSPNGATAEFFAACLLGSCGVVLAVLWERAFYPGLLDISTPYRTVALFWEMHVGGAALDAYLVLIAPLLVWAWRARVDFPSRLASGVFVLAFVYVCLTTYSRGVVGAIAGSLFLLGALLMWRRLKDEHAKGSISPGGALILFLVAAEIALLLGADSFMSRRMAATQRDFGGRLQHWERGIGLLRSPGEWLFGIGLGRLPARLTQGEHGLALPGTFNWQERAGRRFMTITGPDGTHEGKELGGLYALSQRVELVPGQRYRFAMDIRSERNVAVLIKVCATHLLYPASCQTRLIGLDSASGWQHVEFMLSGLRFKTKDWRGVGHGVLSLSALTNGATVEITNLELSAGGANLLRNAQFLDEGRSWFPAARSYFLPWHIDNLYLEILIETGLIGLIGFLVIVCRIIWRLFLAYRQGNNGAPYYLTCIVGLMALGLVVSVFDMPRVATLSGLFFIWAWQYLVTERGDAQGGLIGADARRESPAQAGA